MDYYCFSLYLCSTYRKAHEVSTRFQRGKVYLSAVTIIGDDGSKSVNGRLIYLFPGLFHTGNPSLFRPSSGATNTCLSIARKVADISGSKIENMYCILINLLFSHRMSGISMRRMIQTHGASTGYISKGKRQASMQQDLISRHV